MKTITSKQWQKMANGIFVYQINDAKKPECNGRFAVRTILSRANCNYNDLATRQEAEIEAERLHKDFPGLSVYFVEFA